MHSWQITHHNTQMESNSIAAAGAGRVLMPPKLNALSYLFVSGSKLVPCIIYRTRWCILTLTHSWLRRAMMATQTKSRQTKAKEIKPSQTQAMQMQISHGPIKQHQVRQQPTQTCTLQIKLQLIKRRSTIGSMCLYCSAQFMEGMVYLQWSITNRWWEEWFPKHT